MLEDCRYGDGKGLTVQVGYRLWNGRVSAIDAESVTFELEDDPKALPRKPRTKRLLLKPAK